MPNNQPDTFQYLHYDLSDGLATVMLNRPDQLNSLNDGLLKELLALSQQLSDDQNVRAVLLTGSGRGFCAGADLGETNADPSPAKRKAQGDTTAQVMRDYMNPIIANFATMPKPVVAAVNGITAGGGVGLALACDLVLAAESASFVQVFIPKLGIMPDLGCTWFLPRLMGRARTVGMALLGEKISAKQAQEWGMIWAAYPDDQLMIAANSMAKKLANGPTYGIASMKKALHLSEENSLLQQLNVEQELQSQCCSTEDFAEGVQAFLDKRSAHFKGC